MLRAIHELKGAKLIGPVESYTAKKAKNSKASNLVVGSYVRSKELLADAAILMLFLYWPIWKTHCEYTIQAAQAGKTCVVEKPSLPPLVPNCEANAKWLFKCGVQCMPVQISIYEQELNVPTSMIVDGKTWGYCTVLLWWLIFPSCRWNHVHDIQGYFRTNIDSSQLYAVVSCRETGKWLVALKTRWDDSIAPTGKRWPLANIQMPNGSVSHIAQVCERWPFWWSLGPVL